MVTRSWVDGAILAAIGLVLWFVVAPLLSPPAFGTIVLVVGVIMAVVGLILLIAALLGRRV